MSRLPNDRPLIPSVLDRLIDLEPHRRTESPMNRTQVLQQMKESVGRDLQALLNTRCRATSWPPDLTELDQSLFAYGIPDCVGINTGSRQQQETLRRLLTRAIETFEPRLTKIRVALADTNDPTDRALRFRIDAMLKIDPAPEPVIYDSKLDATSGDFSVKGVRR
ncbi:type VI secretion system baseplate subunit TssE [Stieleria sp. TO1_6]|uniref:type VI secretion system baseplate subunit TssE n=1 Tax=Stieleria tagensis TaxID=2956795 RepID=UPI00209B46E6|nr:type VI secretion system baseplate subunit TssE [Stieleria tagensis]MCO8121094.1 type VI secretion system baseplate subunit TssE [Stieleria tagensis]